MKEKPTPPGNNECCESGCTPCVWDRYYEELREWQQQQALAEEAGQEEA